MKKFILVVEYECGSISVEVETSDLVEALNIFDKKLSKRGFKEDKGLIRPSIKRASLYPLWYDSVFKGEE